MMQRAAPPAPILLAGSALAVSALLPWAAAWFIALAAIIGLGVPHGALDGEVARAALRPRFGRLWFVVFSLPYLALSGFVLVAWRFAPLPALASFLALSVWHFGSEDARSGSAADILLRGGLPIAVPVLAHPAATAFVFGAVAQVPMPVPPPWLTLGAVAWLAAAAIALSTAFCRWDGRRLATGGVLMALFILLPPLTAFAIYFVCVHAPSHTARLISGSHAPRVDGWQAAWRLALPLSGLTLLIGALLWPLYTGSSALRLCALTIQILSALTLPHMLLNRCLSLVRPKPSACPGAASGGRHPARLPA